MKVILLLCDWLGGWSNMSAVCINMLYVQIGLYFIYFESLKILCGLFLIDFSFVFFRLIDKYLNFFFH